MKIEKNRKNAYAATIALIVTLVWVFVLIALGFYHNIPLHGRVRAQAGHVATSLAHRRQAVLDYVRYHAELPAEGRLFPVLIPYLQQILGERYMPEYDLITFHTFLRVTPNGAWIGYDLAEAFPVETWWERLWQSRNDGIAIRMILDRTNISWSLPATSILYGSILSGSRDAMTPPVSDDLDSRYREWHDAIWLRVDVGYQNEENIR